MMSAYLFHTMIQDAAKLPDCACNVLESGTLLATCCFALSSLPCSFLCGGRVR
jgi:hypothetical protein